MSITPNLPGALRAMHAGLVHTSDGHKSLTLTDEQWKLLLAAADELERKPPPPFYRIDTSGAKLTQLDLDRLHQALRSNQPSVLVAGQSLPLEIIQPTTPDQARMVEAIGQALAHRDCLPEAVVAELEQAIGGGA